jgi:hypothetical protein
MQERCAYSFAVPVISHGHPNSSDVTTTWLIGECVEPKVADNLIVNTGYKMEGVLRWLCDSLTPALGRREWDL